MAAVDKNFMTFTDSVNAFEQALAATAKDFGLYFVSGPGSSSVAPPSGNFGQTNGQERATFLFAVAKNTSGGDS